jgi:hypothetical protein
METRVETSYDYKIVKKDNQYLVEKTTLQKTFDVLLHRWSPTKKVKTEYLPLSEAIPPTFKEVEIEFLFRRKATDTHTLLPLEAFFIQKVKAKIPNIDEYKDLYLTCVDGVVCLNDLANGVTQPLSIKDKMFERIEKPERISHEQARKMIENGAQLYEELPSGELVLILSG